jgi:hypothetical protein
MEITAAIDRLLRAYTHLHPEITSIEVRCQRRDGSDVCILSQGRSREEPDLSAFET